MLCYPFHVGKFQNPASSLKQLDLESHRSDSELPKSGITASNFGKSCDSSHHYPSERVNEMDDGPAADDPLFGQTHPADSRPEP